MTDGVLDEVGTDRTPGSPPDATGGSPVHRAVAERPQDVADIVVQLNGPVHDEHELLELLQQVVAVAARVIPGADHAGVTVHVDGVPFTAVHTDACTLEVDAHQYAADDGPCLHAMRAGELVHVDVAASTQRWPQFAADAHRAGISSFLAAPLGSTGHRLGALNLYSRSPDGFDRSDTPVLEVLADHATRAVENYARLSAADDLVLQLREAMASRAPIEQAKGILMAVHGIDDAAAFDRLRTESQQRNVRLHQVAVEFVRAHTAR